MTEKEAIEQLEELSHYCALKNIDREDDIFGYFVVAIQVIENLLEKKDALINTMQAKFERLENLEDNTDMLKLELENKNKIIDLMADEINETDRGYIDYCNMKIVCDRNCKNCIRQYFERKVEENK